MNKVKWSGALRSMALLAFTACVAAPAMAYDQRGDSIFSRIDPLLRDRAFMRLNYIHATVKTTSGDAYDVTGPVVRRDDLTNFIAANPGFVSMFLQRTTTGTRRIPRGEYGSAGSVLADALDQDASEGICDRTAGLGTPCGIRARSSSTLATPALSLGYYLDDGLNWVAEAFLLAAPLKAEVFGAGDNGLSGKKIIDLKLLPPTVVLGRYFGDANSRIRPFVGMGASYAIFFDVRATETLNTYQGGPTSISVKNALGFGPFFGVKTQMNDDWHFSLNVGKLRYKTEATLVTRDTRITAESQVVQDFGGSVTNASTTALDGTIGRFPIEVGPAVPGGVPQVAGLPVGASVEPLTALMCDLARAKHGNNECNQGTFVRKQKTKLDNTLFMLSVGRRF
jgi:outer membrane protein W